EQLLDLISNAEERSDENKLFYLLKKINAYDDIVGELSNVGYMFNSDSYVNTLLNELRILANYVSINLSESFGSYVGNKGIVEDSYESFLEQITEERKGFAKDKEKLEGANTLLHAQIQALSGKVEEIQEKATEDYNGHVETIQEQEQNVREMLGILSEDVNVGGYQISAAKEEKSANHLRWGAIVFMTLLVALVGFAFWETTLDTYNVEKSISRFVFAAFLSVPAAYFARESSRHRKQQYEFHQTALELATLTPYIGTLPEDMQHKIKIEVAKRFFCSKTPDGATAQESYPINIHELLMSIISKADFKPTAKSTDGVEKN
ncbi:MAG: hypothetical protein OET90_04760, partial [Desulfuromonadales bacterium]|nr:hypothetical protein [Desulfuromonadales bacterium]